jgi:hypothetical protein
MRLFAVSIPTLFQREVGSGKFGGSPEFKILVHVGVPPSPLAWESNHVSPIEPGGVSMVPPKIVIVLLLDS